MTTTTKIKVENKLNIKPEILFKDLAPDTTTPYAPMTEKEMLVKLQKSREQTTFRDADDVISDIKSKYGL